MKERTLDLLIAFAVELADCLVFTSEMLDALQQWVCDLQLSIFLVVVIARLCVVKRCLQLSNDFDELSRLLCKLVFFTGNDVSS